MPTPTIIVESVAGSRLYGTNRPDSDTDIRGVALAPVASLLGLDPAFEQIEQHEPQDRTIWELRKFMHLAAANNPNILDTLYAPRRMWIQCSSWWEMLYEYRHDMLSQRVRKTYAGYATSQLGRMEGHVAWLRSAPAQPDVNQYGAYDSRNQWRWNSQEAAAEYQKLHKTWSHYQEWLDKRNPERHALEVQYGYDCYVDGTEFLTLRGWLLYDEITDDDLLATVSPRTQRIEFQPWLERVEKPYNGSMYKFENQQTRCVVTPNHRMYISPMHRSRANGFSYEYDENSADWQFVSAADVVNGRRSHHHVLVHGSTRGDDWVLPIDVGYDDDTLLRLVGLYLSEGCVAKRRPDGMARAVRISQKLGNRVDAFIDRHLPHVPFNRYAYDRTDSWRRAPMTEVIWDLYGEIAAWLQVECGEHSDAKRLPSFAMQLSWSQAWVLLEAMLAGDGTNRGDNRSWVYYTSSRQLADDIQAMCVCVGITCQIWGPYDHGMFQVYIRKPKNDLRVMTLKRDHIQEVSYDGRIVCFTVPNEMLVTRLGGKVALHGNTKHGAHLARLLVQGRDILTHGTFSPMLEGENLRFVRGVLHGEMAYDALVDWAKFMFQELKTMPSDLPTEPRIDEINVAVQEIYWNHIKHARTRTEGIA